MELKNVKDKPMAATTGTTIKIANKNQYGKINQAGRFIRSKIRLSILG
jgi:hypothetical protein